MIVVMVAMRREKVPAIRTELQPVTSTIVARTEVLKIIGAIRTMHQIHIVHLLETIVVSMRLRL